MPAPAGFIRLGLIGYVEKGDYDSTRVYYRNQVVHYEEASYYCKVDNTIGKPPTNKNYWGIMAGGGGTTTKTLGLRFEDDEQYLPSIYFITEVIVND